MQSIEFILSVVGIGFFGTMLFFTFLKMKQDLTLFTWKRYCKQCGIYQGRSYWTTVKKIMVFCGNWVKRKNILKDDVFR